MEEGVGASISLFVPHTSWICTVQRFPSCGTGRTTQNAGVLTLGREIMLALGDLYIYGQECVIAVLFWGDAKVKLGVYVDGLGAV
jgi:hypothetical protein